MIIYRRDLKTKFDNFIYFETKVQIDVQSGDKSFTRTGADGGGMKSISPKITNVNHRESLEKFCKRC